MNDCQWLIGRTVWTEDTVPQRVSKITDAVHLENKRVKLFGPSFENGEMIILSNRLGGLHIYAASGIRYRISLPPSV